MSDRELRDEIEVLYGQLKAERAKADAPLAEELAKARQALVTEVAELKVRKQSLRERLEELSRLKDELETGTAAARRELSKARSEIAARQPLGNPLHESYSNWETPAQNGGCAMGVVLLTCGAVSALGWWLS